MTYVDASGTSSWIDHFVCDDGLSSLALSVNPLQCGLNLSDHLPISATFNLPSVVPDSSPLSNPSHRTNWDLVAEQHVQLFFHSLLVSRLPVQGNHPQPCIQ